jgi:hypothetical protein
LEKIVDRYLEGTGLELPGEEAWEYLQLRLSTASLLAIEVE